MSSIITPMNLGSYYVKKEDAKAYLVNQKLSVVIVGTAFVFVPTYFILNLRNRLLNDFMLGSFVGIENWINIGSVLLIFAPILYWIFSYVIFTKEYQKKFEKKLSKFEPKEMINVTELVDRKLMTRSFLSYVIILSLGIFCYVYPILSLGASI